MSSGDAHVDASMALRSLLRSCSSMGISYSDILTSSGLEGQWTNASLKQLVYRDGAIRKSEKVSALALAVSNLIKRKLDEVGAQNRFKLEIQDIEYFIEDTASAVNVSMASKYIGNRFQSIRRASAGFGYPSKQAFVRYDWTEERFIIVLVTVLRGDNGSVFSMKITGRDGVRRVVLGDILSTVRNTYYSGLAYQVNDDIGQEEFIRLDVFNIDTLFEVVDSNEIGKECIGLNNESIHKRESSVTFHGLDGRGAPICGVGALIRESAFKKYNIPEDTFSSVSCTSCIPELQDLMEKSGSRTLHAL